MVIYQFQLGKVPVGKEAECNLYTLPAALERMKFSIFSMYDSFRDKKPYLIALAYCRD